MIMIKKGIPYALVTSSVITRLVPHLPNFTASNSAVVYGNTVLKPIWNIFIPLILFFISDIINLYAIQGIGFTAYSFFYSFPAYLASSIITRLVMNNKKKICVFSASSLVIISSVIFFIFSNFVVFIESYLSKPNYSLSFENMMITYFDAIPFFGWEVLANSIYSAFYFTIHYFVIEKPETINQKEENLINEDNRIVHNSLV